MDNDRDLRDALTCGLVPGDSHALSGFCVNGHQREPVHIVQLRQMGQQRRRHPRPASHLPPVLPWIASRQASHQRQPICHRPIRDTRSRIAGIPPVLAVKANAASRGPSRLGKWVGHPLPWQTV